MGFALILFILILDVVLQTMGLTGPINHLDIFLPVGISFYTFQTILHTRHLLG